MSAPLPQGAELLARPEELAFRHCAALPLPVPMAPIALWDLIMAQPLPLMKQAFWLRDFISARFGVARIGGFSGRRRGAPQPGDRLDFFLIERLEAQVMTLTARDRHLDVMVCITTGGGMAGITTSVKTHNAFGRLYMLPVAPAHRLILWAVMRRLARALPAA
ncbi:MAG: DUF2867 domain-containing protein [Pararhodobacter sp.]